MNGSDFYALMQVHKMEAAEGMAYINASIYITFGILAYLGAVKEKTIGLRISLAIGYIVTCFVELRAILASNAIHQALHYEIGKIISENDELIKTVELYKLLSDMKLPSRSLMITGFSLFCLLVTCAILFIGRDNLIDLLRNRRKEL